MQQNTTHRVSLPLKPDSRPAQCRRIHIIDNVIFNGLAVVIYSIAITVFFKMNILCFQVKWYGSFQKES